MKILVNVSIRDRHKSLYKNDKMLIDVVDGDKFWLEFDSSSQILNRVLELGREFGGLSFHVRSEFTKKEFDSVALYLLRVTRGELAESIADEMENAKYINSLKSFPPSSKTGVRILERYYLSSINVKPDANSIYAASDAFMATQDVCKTLDAERISGLRFGPVCHPNTGIPQKVVSLLIPTNILPLCEHDQSVTIMTLDERDRPTTVSVCPELNSHMLRGCISYSPEATKSASDFNCTCEAFGGLDIGQTIVSRRFVDVVKQHNIKGVRFLPVLDTSTPLYAKYRALFQPLADNLSKIPLKSHLGS